MVILENIDIDKAILQNIDIDKISNRFKFGISNRASGRSCWWMSILNQLLEALTMIFLTGTKCKIRFIYTQHLDPGCAIFVRDFFRWSVFGIMTKLMGSPKTHGVTGHVGIREFSEPMSWKRTLWVFLTALKTKFWCDDQIIDQLILQINIISIHLASCFSKLLYRDGKLRNQLHWKVIMNSLRIEIWISPIQAFEQIGLPL